MLAYSHSLNIDVSVPWYHKMQQRLTICRCRIARNYTRFVKFLKFISYGPNGCHRNVLGPPLDRGILVLSVDD
jgi:hypothetical protein